MPELDLASASSGARRLQDLLGARERARRFLERQVLSHLSEQRCPFIPKNACWVDLQEPGGACSAGKDSPDSNSPARRRPSSDHRGDRPAQRQSQTVGLATSTTTETDLPAKPDIQRFKERRSRSPGNVGEARGRMTALVEQSSVAVAQFIGRFWPVGLFGRVPLAARSSESAVKRRSGRAPVTDPVIAMVSSNFVAPTGAGQTGTASALITNGPPAARTASGTARVSPAGGWEQVSCAIGSATVVSSAIVLSPDATGHVDCSVWTIITGQPAW